MRMSGLQFCPETERLGVGVGERQGSSGPDGDLLGLEPNDLSNLRLEGLL